MAEARRVADAMSDEIKQECTPIPATFLRVTAQLRGDVRFGSLADMLGCMKSVRFTPESRHSARRRS